MIVRMKSASGDHLPEPGSQELRRLLKTAAHRLLYTYLYQRRDNPPTMREIRAYVDKSVGESPAQTDRRVRELRDYFDLPTVHVGRESRYKLRGRKTVETSGARKPLSKKKRAQVLAPKRCAQCGRTPRDHGVVLVVDHKLPHHWGGSEEIENLQPLCEECNTGKQAFYATYDNYADAIRASAGHAEPHGRIGELLKSFDGDWVPSDLVSVVASMQQYQEDWQRRTRELRTLGWTIETRKSKDPTSGKVVTFYRAAHWEPWPSGSISTEIRRLKQNTRKDSR